MVLTKLYFLPVVIFVTIPTTFLITYSVSVWDGHVNPELPYISDTGTFSPESCIFGQFLNIAAFVLSICVYLRYLEVKHYPELSGSGLAISPKLNRATFILGQLSCLGLDLVANFQETNVPAMHMVGANLLFVIGTIHFLLQVYISRKMPELVPKNLVVIRAVLVLICAVTTLITVPTTLLAIYEYKGPKDDRIKKWTPEDGGYDLHLVSAAAEWILTLAYCLLILTFAPEFYNLELVEPIIRYKRRKTSTKTQY
ncbi:hypothetical protein L9F63_021927 [Diploptera punctata]|uniref:CWH43-like N-terminal domain-containing protein n=1 Tax=Diploptera punctata TaxID=6984 RepID=A0AAD7ZNF9_DIPPU|nr:hypothetical protein L9F63_021927 [Diploptera punctata]